VFLLDTNIISEVRKGERCDRRVANWYASIEDSDLFLSVLVLGEIRTGLELARRNDSAKADALGKWLQLVEETFSARILSVDAAVAHEWGRMSATRPLAVIDGLLAATAKVHGLTLATRNEEDVRGLGAGIVNPFKPVA
jgi:predicted nucleic acid-binding protein